MTRLAVALFATVAVFTTPHVARAAQNPSEVPRAQEPGEEGVTVTGEDRVVCRRVTRTATRMRTGRICRPVSEWRNERGDRATADPNETIDGAADSLEVLGEKISTGCVGGLPGQTGGAGPYRR